MSRKMAIGSETEYGIMAKRNGRPVEPGSFAKLVVKALRETDMRFYDGGLSGIPNLAEHRRLDTLVKYEKFKKNLEELLNILINEPGLRQRLALGGYYLENGSRFYVDMQHPEYSSPETANPYDAVAAQKAGDELVEICRLNALEYAQGQNVEIRIDKNNSDGKGNSYASHENYSLTPKTFMRITGRNHTFELDEFQRSYISTPPEERDLSEFVKTFFVTRQILIGAGKACYEVGKPVPYQISQRADFIMAEVSIDTTKIRGIINIRNEALGDGKITRRLHVICGDSNMSELSLFLKYGITSLFLMMLEDGLVERASAKFTAPLQNPVRAFRNVSRDLTLKHRLFLQGGTRASALDLQKEFCELAKSYVQSQNMGEVWQDVVKYWQGTLEGLENENRHMHDLAGNLDWVKKEFLLKRLQRRHNIDAWHEKNREFDLQYTNTDRECGIYWKLAERGDILRIVPDSAVSARMYGAPKDTRAWFRGEILKRYKEDLDLMRWDNMLLKQAAIWLRDPLMPTHEQLGGIFDGDPGVDVFLRRLQSAIARDPGINVDVWRRRKRKSSLRYLTQEIGEEGRLE